MSRSSSADALRILLAQLAEQETRRTAVPMLERPLWHRAKPRSSQRRGFRTLMGPDILLGMALGGVRSGKSDGLSQVSIAMAAGEDAYLDLPSGRLYWIRRWLAMNCLPATCIPRGPGRVWVASATFAAATEQIRLTLLRNLPKNTRLSQWDQPKEALAELSNGGVITSKAYKQYDQDPQTWEGAPLRFGGLDEQPNQYANLEALFSRLIDGADDVSAGGRAIIALTPLRGKRNWFYQRLVKASARPDWVRIVQLKGADNPHISQKARIRAVGASDISRRASRDTGVFSDPTGSIYHIDDVTHIVEPFDIPPNWIRWVGVDWGARSPHIVWVAEDPSDATLYVYRELQFRRGSGEQPVTDRQLVRLAIEEEERERAASTASRVLHSADVAFSPFYRVADSESPNAIAEANDLGWFVDAAVKTRGSIREGIEDIQALLQGTDVEGQTMRPRLLFIRGACDVLLEEMQGMQWSESLDPDEAPVDPRCPDHGPDALRYVVAYRRAQGMR